MTEEQEEQEEQEEREEREEQDEDEVEGRTPPRQTDPRLSQIVLRSLWDFIKSGGKDD